MSYILIPLYAAHLGMTGVQIGTLISLPMMLHIAFSIAGGALTDRIGGRSLSSFSCLLTVLACLSFIVSVNFILLLGAQLLMVMARSTFWTANLSLASQLPGDPGKQMGRFTVATNAGQMAGNAGAGMLISIVGFRIGFAGAAFLALCALALNQLHRPAALAPVASRPAVVATYAKLIRHRPVLFSMLCAYISALPIALLISFYPLLFTQNGLSSDTAGGLIALRGAGAIAAGFLAGRLVKDVKRLATPLISSAVVGVCVILTAALGQPALIAIFMFILGVSSSLLMVYAQVTIRASTSGETRGSAMALFNVGFGSSILTVPFVTGIVRDFIGTEPAFYLIGCFAIACGLSLIPLRPPAGGRRDEAETAR